MPDNFDPAKGGRARAAVLTDEQRKEIARNAAKMRWAREKGVDVSEIGQASVPDQSQKDTPKQEPSMPTSLFRGKLEIGDSELVCYVLNNFKRVIAQREVVRILTGQSKGDLMRYLDAQNLQPYIKRDLILDQTYQFKIQGTQKLGTAYEATLLLDICDAYLRARESGKLHPSQLPIAHQAEIITRATAKVGIIALIDEATGFEKYKKGKELQFKLQAFIAEEMQEWARMFPEEFWYELARLEGIHYSARNRPLRWGKYVMMFVYDAIDPDVGKALREKNPDPHFLQNHHQWLKKFGRDKVHDQIVSVMPVMKLCTTMKDFKRKFAYVFKHAPLQISFDEEWFLQNEEF
jgi:hypothetical protein